MTFRCPECFSDYHRLIRSDNGRSRHECEACGERFTMQKVEVGELTKLRQRVISLAHRLNQEPIVAMRIPHKGTVGETVEKWNRERKPLDGSRTDA